MTGITITDNIRELFDDTVERLGITEEEALTKAVALLALTADVKGNDCEVAVVDGNNRVMYKITGE